MKKKIATRVIIHNPIKNSVLACHPTGRKWKSRDGGIATGVYNIPGGEIDEGEDKLECIIREAKEETDLDLKKSNLKYLGFYKYSEYKDLHFYYYPIEDLEISKLKCESYFENQDGKMLPEINGYEMFNLESDLEMFFPVLQNVLKKVIKDYPELFN